MLKHRTTLRVHAVAAAVVVLAAVGLASHAFADDVEVYCPPTGGPCVVVVSTSGGHGGNGGGGTHVECDPDLGCPSMEDLCYYKRAEPQPPFDDKIWEGRTEGVIYVKSCLKQFGPLGTHVWAATWVWLPEPPPAMGGTSAAELAAQAINRLGIRGPAIGIAPSPSGSGLVGLPVWLWTEQVSQTWGPLTATASVPGLSVTATATAVRIVWNMGDGGSVTCANPGTPYEPRYGRSSSPTCGYRYVHASDGEPGGRYTVTGTTTWQVDWAGGGQSGSLTVTRISTTTIQINEAKVVTS